jgi:hypothetical protein
MLKSSANNTISRNSGVISTPQSKSYIVAKFAVATLKNQVILFTSAIIVIVIQIIGIMMKKTKSISFAIAGIISLFMLFFVSLFPLIGRFASGFPITIGNIFSHILSPMNGFVILLIQTMMNLIESIPNTVPFSIKVGDEMGKDILKISGDIAKGTSNLVGEIEKGAKKVVNDVKEGYTSCNNSLVKELKPLTTEMDIKTMVIYKNTILLLTSVLTFIYLLMINMYGTISSFAYYILMMVYLGLFVGYSYLKYEIYIYYKYYITDDYNR